MKFRERMEACFFSFNKVYSLDFFETFNDFMRATGEQTHKLYLIFLGEFYLKNLINKRKEPISADDKDLSKDS